MIAVSRELKVLSKPPSFLVEMQEPVGEGHRAPRVRGLGSGEAGFTAGCRLGVKASRGAGQAAGADPAGHGWRVGGSAELLSALGMKRVELQDVFSSPLPAKHARGS